MYRDLYAISSPGEKPGPSILNVILTREKKTVVVRNDADQEWDLVGQGQGLGDGGMGTA